MCRIARFHTKLSFIIRAVVIIAAVQHFTFSFGQSENVNLEQPLTISYQDASLEDILDEITNQTGVEFSFNSDLVGKENSVTYRCKHKPLEKALQELFNLTNLEYEIVGQHLVLKKRTKTEPVQIKKPLRFTISGFVIDAHTKEALIGAAVYNAKTGMGA